MVTVKTRNREEQKIIQTAFCGSVHNFKYVLLESRPLPPIYKTQTTKIQNTYNTEKLIKHFLDDARRHNEDMFIVHYYI